MKAIFPAICGALLLATSPLAAAPSKTGGFAAAQARASSDSTRQAPETNRQILDRSVSSQVQPNAGSTFIERQSTRTTAGELSAGRPSTGQVMGWSAIGTGPKH